MQSKNNQINLVLLSLSTTLAIFLGLFILEGFFVLKEKNKQDSHWVDPNTEFDDELGWRIIPSQTIQVPGWGKVSSNSKGYRSAEPEPDKKNILILGDSVAWGYGMNDEKIFSHFLQKDLKDTDYQVHNLGVSGYGIGQYYLYLKENLPMFDQVEHVFLIIYAPNDLYDTRSNEAYGKRKPQFVVKDGRLELRHRKIFKLCLRNLLSMSQTVRYLESEWPQLKSFFSRLAGDRKVSFEEAQQVTIFLINRMEKMVRERGSHFSLVISPSVYDFFKKTRGLAWFEEYCLKRDQSCLHLKETILENYEGPPADLFGDEHHYNSKGHRIVADALLEKVTAKQEEVLV